MRSRSAVFLFVFAAVSGLAAGRAISGRAEQPSAAGGPAQASSAASAWPKDIYSDTGNRLPAIKRDDLDEAGKKMFDARGPSADFFGPAPIRLYSPQVAEHMGAVNDYLRNKSGLDPRLVQLAILVTAREFDCEYVWTAHEPQGLKAGLEPQVIDVVRYRKSPQGLAEKDSVIIQLGREVIVKHRVSADVAARAARLFGKQQFVEYVSLMGDYAATTVLLNVFDQHVRPADKPLLPIP